MRHPSKLVIHWFCALTFAFSTLAPAMSHALAASGAGTVLSMEICLADGSKQIFDLETEESARMLTDCPYCVAQSPVLPTLLTNLQFGIPKSFFLTPTLSLESAKTLFVWVKLPSQGPPAKNSI